MKVTNIKSNTNFNGIKLSNSSFGYSRYVAQSLMHENIDVLGHRKHFVINNFVNKKAVFDYIRNKTNFSGTECGFVFLPWSGECWILADKCFEHKLIYNVKESDKNAVCNILL